MLRVRWTKHLSTEDLLATREGKGYEKLPASDKMAVKVRVSCALNWQEVVDADIDQLRDEDFTEAESLELMSQADVGIMFNMITMNAGIPMDAGYRRRLPEDL